MKEIPLFRSKKILLIICILLSGTFLTFNPIKPSAKSLYTTLTLNDTFVQGNIPESGTVNFYTVTVPSAGWLTITYQGWNIYDSYYQLVSQDQAYSYFKHNVYYSSDTNPKTSYSTIALESGTYLIKIYAAGNKIGDYRLKGSFVSAENNESEPNGYFSNGMPLSEGQLITGFFSADDNLDFYKVTLSSAMTIRITYISRIRDSYFSVWDKNYLELKKQNVDYASESSPITKTLDIFLNAGTNYIKVYPAGSHTGRYQLKWEAAPTLITNISITGSNTVEVGDSIKLSANIIPTTATNKQLKWSSSNKSIATVDNTGLVKAIGVGTVTILAEATDSSGCYCRFDVTVKEGASKIVKQVPLKKVTSKNRKLTVKWKKISNAKKYQVQISPSKKFKYSDDIDRIVSSKKNKLTVRLSYLSKTVYVRVRAIDNYGKVGKWSKVKRIKWK